MTPQQIACITAGLSAPKLLTYEQLGFLPNSQELVRAYLALQDVSAHLFMPLQMLELSLRNNIHSAVNARFPSVVADTYWFDHIPITPEAQGQVKDARKLAKRNHPHGHTADDIVCSLMFGFWVYLLDKPYRVRGPNHFWQTEIGNIFPGREAKQSVASIFDDLKSINRYRNRLYHHEPVWKHKSVASFQDALNQIEQVYDSVIKGIELVNPSKTILMDKMAFRKKFDDCRNEYSVEFKKNISIVVPA